MADMTTWVKGKAYRAYEALNLIGRYAADTQTRRSLVHIYSSLSHPERYEDTVELRLRINGRNFPFQMRVSDIFILGEILHEKQYKLTSRLPEQPTIIDLGANIGISVIWFLSLYPQAVIYTFEPAQDNLGYLEANIDGLRNIILEKAAVGSTSGEAILHHGEFGGMHSLAIEGEGEAVPLYSLADYMEEKNIDRVDLLKLDIEGSELDALEGLGARISDVDVIVGEVHESIIDEQTFYDFLSRHGFKVLWKRFFHESREQQVHGFEASRLS